MDEGVAIWYRGARYELGRGPGFYGLWDAGGSWRPALERWPETPEGWTAAWARFTTAEVPGSILHLSEDAGRAPGPAAPATPPAGLGTPGGAVPGGPATPGAAVPGDRTVPVGWAAPATGWPGPPAAAPPATERPVGPVATSVPGAADPADAARAIGGGIMIAAGVGSGVAALFPAYSGGSSLASEAVLLIPHLIYLAAWAVAAALIFAGGTRRQVGALLGTGVGVVAFGMFLADLGQAISGGPGNLGSGLLLSAFSWLACTAGSVLAFRPGLAGGLAKRADWRRGLTGLAVAVIASLGAAVAFVPSWDSFTLRTAAGAVNTITAGYAFANPGLAVAGNVAVMIALVVVAAIAALWRPGRLGAALLAGAAIPMVAQAISAVVQISGPVSPSQFQISPSQAAQLGLVISPGLTPAFWIYCAFVAGLIGTAGWMLRPAGTGRQASPAGYGVPAGGGPFGASAPAVPTGASSWQAAGSGPAWTQMGPPAPGAAAPPSA